jgi:predicted glycosyltransferase
MAHRKRFLFYSQHVVGGGHFVRTCEIARAIAERHDVYIVDGGRPIPRPALPHGISLVSIPPLGRDGPHIVPLDPEADPAEVFRERQRRLLAAVEQIRPDMLMVEHFPFSKWPLRDEVFAAVRRARHLNPRVKIVCSVRDMGLPGLDDTIRSDYRREVESTLAEYFDLLLVHGDPRVATLDEEFPWLSRVQLPMHYTGYVTQRCKPLAACPHAATGSVVVSAGTTGGTQIASCAIDAWKHLAGRPAVDGRELLVFLSLSVDDEAIRQLEHRAAGLRVRLLPFSTDFVGWMQACAVSISTAGYNTCTNILETRRPAILIPPVRLFDQPHRARRFAERDLARRIAEEDLTSQGLAEVIAIQLEAPPSEHNVNLQGAGTTRDILEMVTETVSVAHFRLSTPPQGIDLEESPALRAAG